MFNKHSIFFTLGVAFIISMLLILFSFFTLIQKDTMQYKHNLKKRYYTVVKFINQEYKRIGFTEPLAEVIHDMGFDIVQNGDIDPILENTPMDLIVKRKMDILHVYIFKGEDHNYIHVFAPFDEYLLIDKKVPLEEYKKITIGIFFIVLIIFFFITYSIYKKLYPLNELKEKIESMGDRDIEFEHIKENGKDEVSLLAKEFKAKSVSLKKVQEARNVFIRNIMHELKTPITKGRFLVELPDSKENKDKLTQVFYQMESLINEFASIEEVITKAEEIEKKEYYFSDILENAADKLLIDEEHYSFNGEDIKVEVNYKLFSIAVKNLMDNGIKYSKDKKVKINIDQNGVSFINCGEKLKYPLENYFEPFFNSESKGIESFGLGLYIVNSILKAHGLELEYLYKEGENSFFIPF